MKERKIMTLGEHLSVLQAHGLVSETDLMGREDEKAENLTYDSREVSEGTVFICKGAAFREEYLKGAAEKGCIMYVSEKKYDAGCDIPYILVTDIRKAMLVLSDFFYCSPWDDLMITAAGGTKGKTTTAYFVKSIVDDHMRRTGGKESGLLSSVEMYDGTVRKESHITTPEAVELQRHLRNALDCGITHLEMEVSSQALKYDRVANMRFDVGIFLNISEDHISPVEHSDFEDYFSSKLKMFPLTETAVVNMDCQFSDRVIRAAHEGSGRVLTFSMKNPSADFFCSSVTKEDEGLRFTVKASSSEWKEKEFFLSMPGLFNIENALAAIAAADVMGIPYEDMVSGLEKARIPGRMEVFRNREKDIIAFVDFAHNRLSFERLLGSAREEYPDHEIRVVFGCPGGKAYTRRKDLPEVASMYAAKVYVTEDDPGPEEREDICRQIAEGLTCSYEIVPDRVEAIEKAVSECEGSTVLMVLGKGDEDFIKYGNEYVKKPADTEVVDRCLKSL